MKKPESGLLLQFTVTIFVFLLAQLFSGSVLAQVKPVYITGIIKLDGSLSDDAWKAAEPVGGFTQKELVEGDPASEKTEVRVLYDDETVYLGFMCHDSDPSGIIARETEYDGALFSDDYVIAVFDTDRDMQAGFAFAVNPNGARRDATFRSGNSETSVPYDDWNAVWKARSVITADGWSAEIAIPFKSLRYPATDIQTWGVNFERCIRRKNEIVLWRGWKRNQGILLLSQAGTMVIDKSIGRKGGANVKP